MSDVGLNVIVLAAFGAVLSHIALFILGFRFNPLFLIAGAFMFISPLTAAVDLPAVGALKWVRLYLTVLLLLVAVLGRRLRIGQMGWVLLIPLGFYTFGAFWAGGPGTILQALLYKGMMLVTLIGGMALASSCRDETELRQSLRLLLLPAAAWVLFILVAMALNPWTISHLGRLMVMGMNPNRIGQTSAPLFIFCVYFALHDPIKAIRLLGYLGAGALAIIILYTGSRGAAGQAAIGGFFLALPLFRSPLYFTLVSIIAAAVGYGAWQFVDVADNTERFTNVSFETREEPWTYAREYIIQKPVLGHGWVYGAIGGDTGEASTQNLHCMYLNIIAETGFIGFSIFAAAVLILMVRGTSLYLTVLRAGLPDKTIYLALAVCASVFAHGVIESGTIMGSTLNCMMWGFSVALFDTIGRYVERQAWYRWPHAVPPGYHPLPA